MIHLLDSENDPAKVLAAQQKLGAQVRDILRTVKQYENDPAKKAEYLTTPSVQNTLHAFGDAFAHVEGDGTHYPVFKGHAQDGTEPDNPRTHPDAYRNYVNMLFSMASQATGNSRAGNSTIANMANKVIISPEAEQTKALDSMIGSVSPKTSSSMVNSPVGDCGFAGDCFSKPIGSQVNPQINSIYGVKK